MKGASKTSSSATAEATGIDYQQYAFSKTFERENLGLFPVNFLREFVPGVKKLNATKRWNVTMLHPTKGICSFYLFKNGRNYTVDTTGLPKGAQIPEKEIIDWCGQELTAHLL